MNEGADKPPEATEENEMKPYVKPQVSVHGSLEEITEAVGRSNKDGLAGSGLL